MSAPVVRGLQDRPRIAWSRFELDNGLKVVVHENRSAPLVAVNIWYRVGAKDEGQGQTGFAHLFEHLMFGGSRHVPGPYVSRLGDIGALAVNGTTSHDRTNYFQVVPTGSLEAALFAESDRMGHFVDALSTETLTQQKGVVLNEKREVEGAPYGLVNAQLLSALYPPGHPYAHPVIGSAEDISRATLDDVVTWFNRYYGPSNAVLALAGDIDVTTARELVERYFGAFSPGPRLTRQMRWIAPTPQGRRCLMEDAVPNARLVMAWPMPPAGEADATRLSIAARLLSDPASSPLVKRLVREEQRALSVSVSATVQLLAGALLVTVTLRPGQAAAPVEKIVHEELQRLMRSGPDDASLELVKVSCQAGAIHLQADMGTVADTLAMNEVFFGQPDRFVDELDEISRMSRTDVCEAMLRWIHAEPLVLQVQPRAAFKSGDRDVDRKAPPFISMSPAQGLPPREAATLSNGLRVLLATRSDLPIVKLRMLVSGGARHEPRTQMGLAELTTGVMLRGAGARDAEAFQRGLQQHAASLNVGVALDQAHATLTAFRSRLAPSLDLLADLLCRPTFDPAELHQVREELIDSIAPSLASAKGIIGWHLPGLMFGAGHPYARLSGGLPSTLASLTVEDLKRFHRAAFHLPAATLLVTGDVEMAELLPLLEERFGAPILVPESRVAAPVGPARPARPGAYLIDMPGAQQSTIAAVQLLPSWRQVDPTVFQFVDANFSGGFSSRLNQLLREKLHWTYGVRSEMFSTLHERLHVTVAPVQADRTAACMVEILAEMRRLGDEPPNAEDLALQRDSRLLRLPARFQTLDSVLNAMELMVNFDLPNTYWDQQVQRMKSVSSHDVATMARHLFIPDKVVWIVVGDRRLLEPQLAAAGLGLCRVLAADHADPYLDL